MLFLFCIPLHKYSKKKKRKPLYTCFIDLCKAFDNVHHGLLWEKLAYLGLCSKILAILQNMYAQASSRIWLCKPWGIRNIRMQKRNPTRMQLKSPIQSFHKWLRPVPNRQQLRFSRARANTIIITSPVFADNLVLLASSPIRTTVLHQSARKLLQNV